MLDAIKNVIQTMFRFFAYPTSTGMRVIGRPGRDAAVFVTCNYDLTLRRVMNALQGLDCYLLVAPTRGINVWCAAGGGIFSAHSVTSVVKTSGIAERVDHRTLILPQLSAPGIDVARVEQETGWRCRFGPVYARDIGQYVAAGYTKTEPLRRVRFPLGDRLEMAVMWAAPMSFVAGLPVALFSPGSVPGLVVLIWAFALSLFALYGPVMRYVPGSVGMVKTLVLGLVGVAGVVTYGLVVGNWAWGPIAGWSFGILAVALVLGFDLDGAGPLNAGSTVAFWGQRWPGILDVWARLGYEFEPWFTLRVDSETCTGCMTCIEVCPKGVYEPCWSDRGQKSRLVHMESCEQCTACVKQCPVGAIVADPPIKPFAHREQERG